MDIRHLVVVLMENLTYDALFGQCTDLIPDTVSLPPAAPLAGRICFNSHPSALRGVGGPCCRSAVPRSDALWYVERAHEGALFTRAFSPVRGPSLPNQLMLLTGQSPFIADVAVRDVPPLPSLAERLDAAGLTWRSYNGRRDAGFALLPQLRDRPECRPWTEVLVDAAQGTLPHVAWIVPPLALSHHPPFPWAWGTAWLSHVLAALATSPAWPHTLVAVLWDDWGGYWDHVLPPVVERWQDGSPFRDGARIPLFLFSDWIRPGPVSTPITGLSVTRLAEELFGLSPLTWRDAEAPSLTPLLGRGRGIRPAVAPLPLPPAWLIDLLNGPSDRLART